MYSGSHFSVGATLGVLLLKTSTDSLFVDSNSFYAVFIPLLIGGVLGSIPDIDVLNKYIYSNITYYERHRKWTHSLFTHIVFALLIGMLAYNKLGFDFWSITISVFLILFSHIVLDMYTSWGVYWFYPFKKAIAFKSISIIDMVFSFIMGIQLVFLFLDFKGYKTYMPIISAFLYLQVCVCIRNYVKKVFETALEKQNKRYYRIDLKPTYMNAFLWTVNVETDQDYLVGYYSIFQKKKTITFASFEKNEHLINYDDAKLLKLIDRFKKAVDNWVSFSIIENKFYINDVRYGFKTTDLTEKEFAVPHLVVSKKDSYDAIRKVKFKKGWFFKLIQRIFKS